MPPCFFIWDDDENVPHLAEHDVTPEEAAYVVEHAPEQDRTVSASTGIPVAFGYTPAGRHLMVAYRFLDEAKTEVYVVTAYDVPPRPRPPQRRGRKPKRS